jgi:hypothetical protein
VFLSSVLCSRVFCVASRVPCILFFPLYFVKYPCILYYVPLYILLMLLKSSPDPHIEYFIFQFFIQLTVLFLCSESYIFLGYSKISYMYSESYKLSIVLVVSCLPFHVPLSIVRMSVANNPLIPNTERSFIRFREFHF